MAQIRLTGGDVFDVRSGEYARQDILIECNRIKAVGSAAELGGSNGATKVDVTGMTIMPGFSNNHIHLGWSGMGWDGGPNGILKDQALYDSDGFNGIKAVASMRSR